jgi:hypothetical protein
MSIERRPCLVQGCPNLANVDESVFCQVHRASAAEIGQLKDLVARQERRIRQLEEENLKLRDQVGSIWGNG